MDSIKWLKSKVAEQLPWIKEAVVNQGKMTPEEFLNLWVSWLVLHGFAKLFGTKEKPAGYILARPARIGWVFDVDIDYFDTLFWFDPEGDVCWIDSLYAPGFYPQILEWIRSTGKTYVAWTHNGKLYFKVIAELSGEVPKRREIEEAFLRNVH